MTHLTHMLLTATVMVVFWPMRADSAMRSPAEFAASRQYSPVSKPFPASTSGQAIAADWLFQIWATTGTRADGQRCRFHPSCSSYMRQSVADRGLLTGYVMGCERLLRDHQMIPIDSYPIIRSSLGVLLFYDPVVLRNSTGCDSERSCSCRCESNRNAKHNRDE